MATAKMTRRSNGRGHILQKQPNPGESSELEAIQEEA